MAERGIIFSAPMVLKLLSGEKTQTRRVVTGKQALDWLQPGGFTPGFVADPGNHMCPYGRAGDRLYVRETWAPADYMAGAGCDREPPQVVAYRADRTARGWNGALQPFDADTNGWNWSKFDGRWKPSIFMPKWASRIWLEITDVRVQRLQEISGEDARAEGVELGEPGTCGAMPRIVFANLWDSINGRRPGCMWESNPWVWAITFTRTPTSSSGTGDSDG